MAVCLSSRHVRSLSKHTFPKQSISIYCNSRLHTSTRQSSVAASGELEPKLRSITLEPAETQESPLARLPTSSLLRSLFLSIFFTSPLLFRPGLAIFQRIADSKSRWLNPDQNPFLGSMIRSTVYNQFCAGRNVAEIDQTSLLCRKLGFSGVILSYSKEVQVSKDKHFIGYDESQKVSMEEEIRQWRQGNLETVDMIQEGDWLAIKVTGAGLGVTDILMNGGPAPTSFIEAMDEICNRTAAKGCHLWIDAEQSILQATIDKWTIDLMRKHNTNGKALVYTTVQAYLKISRQKIQRQLELAATEGWTYGAKLVRGAYISNDIRTNIHDTKAETDASYNSIVEDLLGGRFPVLANNPDLKFCLMLAGHNTNTIRKANELASTLAAQGRLRVYPQFAQLQGMADEVGCELAQKAESVKKSGIVDQTVFIPRVYKYLTWGSLQECMQYLTRRLVENRGAADRMMEGLPLLRRELWRRLFGKRVST